MQIKPDETDSWEKATKILKEAGPDNMKFIITQRPNVAKGTDFVYEFSSTLFTQQGSCVIRLDNTAHTRYGKSPSNSITDIDGDVNRMKTESVSYMGKVIDGLREGCKSKNGAGNAIFTGFSKNINIPGSDLVSLSPSISLPISAVFVLILIIVFLIYWIFIKHMIKSKSFFTSRLFLYILIVLLFICVYLLLKGIFFKE